MEITVVLQYDGWITEIASPPFFLFRNSFQVSNQQPSIVSDRMFLGESISIIHQRCMLISLHCTGEEGDIIV